jgi:hypothetical protein
VRAVVTALLVLALGVPAASARSTWAAVPTFVQNLVKTKAGPLAYAPTRLPFRYRYLRYRWDASRRTLTLWFADRRFPPNGKHTLAFTSQRFGHPLARCGDGRQKTMQLDGNKVYSDGAVAWRCVRGRDGRNVKLAATGPKLPDTALGIVVASAKRL